ncbi:MAG: hypothetical protein LLG20_15920, partial [Acidobacteriales bacterium]|nr:hypothetical protein [Terriglobales bacterium]
MMFRIIQWLIIPVYNQSGPGVAVLNARHICVLLLAAALAPAQKPAVGDPYAASREAMVRDQLASRDITNSGVLAAMRAVPRH